MLTDKEVATALEASPAPRVTENGIKDRITTADYLTHGITTICILTMYSGFKFIGHSTPASPENYRQDVGEKYAFDNAFKQVWSHEGYLLKDKLFHSQ